jgi:hypothetical protein
MNVCGRHAFYYFYQFYINFDVLHKISVFYSLSLDAARPDHHVIFFFLSSLPVRSRNASNICSGLLILRYGIFGGASESSAVVTFIKQLHFYLLHAYGRLRV